MKLSVYFDVFPWTTQENIYFQNIPADKPMNGTRYRVDVEIPDPKNPDVIIEGEANEASDDPHLKQPWRRR